MSSKQLKVVEAQEPHIRRFVLIEQFPGTHDPAPETSPVVIGTGVKVGDSPIEITMRQWNEGDIFFRHFHLIDDESCLITSKR